MITELQRQRLLTLRGLLTNIDPKSYDHSVYFLINDFYNLACALGHAVLNRETHFPDLNLRAAGSNLVPIDHTPSLASNWFVCSGITEDYFGEGSYSAIFESDAEIAGVHSHEVEFVSELKPGAEQLAATIANIDAFLNEVHNA